MKELKKLRKIIQSIRLSEQEKRDGRNEFLEFMEKNPVHRQIPERGFAHFLDRFYAMTRRPLAATATLMGVFVVTASGISYAAESSVPGDVLYPFKVGVNEQVQGFFHFDSKSKAQWEIDRIQRRLEEAETLKGKGKLDIKTKHELKEELKINTKIVEEHIKDLRAEGEEDAAAEIESSFDTLFTIHEDAALDIEFEVADWKPEVEPKTEIEIENENEIETEVKTEETPGGEVEEEEEEETNIEIESEVLVEPEISPVELETELQIDTGITLPNGLKPMLEKRMS